MERPSDPTATLSPTAIPDSHPARADSGLGGSHQPPVRRHALEGDLTAQKHRGAMPEVRDGALGRGGATGGHLAGITVC